MMNYKPLNDSTNQKNKIDSIGANNYLSNNSLYNFSLFTDKCMHQLIPELKSSKSDSAPMNKYNSCD